MLKVLFDHQAFQMQKYGGISRYFANLYRYLNTKNETVARLGVLYNENHYLADQDIYLQRRIGKMLFRKVKRLKKWNQYYAIRLIKRADYDIFHPTYYDPYFISELKAPFVLTVHDMIHELFPEYFSPNDQDSYNKRILIEKAAHIIAISESTKADVQRIYGVPDHKISVIYHGYIKNPIKEGTVLNFRYHKYILFVGERIRYKNFDRMLQAFAQNFNPDEDIHLLCIGGGSFGGAEQEQILRYGLTEHVHQLSLTDDELQKAYQHAMIFVYPSLYEGFGLPLLEAFANGCPVAVSNTSCFKEVGGDAVAYFDPYDSNDISRAIKKIIYNPELSDNLRSKGFRQLEGFTMEQCFAKTLEVYHKVINV